MGQRPRNQLTVTGWVNLRSFVKQHREIAIDSDIIGKGRGKITPKFALEGRAAQKTHIWVPTQQGLRTSKPKKKAPVTQ